MTSSRPARRTRVRWQPSVGRPGGSESPGCAAERETCAGLGPKQTGAYAGATQPGSQTSSPSAPSLGFARVAPRLCAFCLLARLAFVARFMPGRSAPISAGNQLLARAFPALRGGCTVMQKLYSPPALPIYQRANCVSGSSCPESHKTRAIALAPAPRSSLAAKCLGVWPGAHRGGSWTLCSQCGGVPTKEPSFVASPGHLKTPTKALNSIRSKTFHIARTHALE